MRASTRMIANCYDQLGGRQKASTIDETGDLAEEDEREK
jgi:hypothetical protein